MGSNNDDVKVTLISADGYTISVDKQLVFESKVLKNIIEIVGEDQLPHQVMPLSNVSKQTLEKMFEYIDYHLRNSSQRANDIRIWDLNFITEVDIDTLLNLIKVSICCFFFVMADKVQFAFQVPKVI